MKRYILLLFFLSTACAKDLGYDYFPTLRTPAPLRGKNVSDYDGLTFLCTMPHSGTNLLSGILTSLTEKPLFWSRGAKWRTGTYVNRFHLPLDYEQIPLLGTHEVSYFSTIAKDKNRLLITVRNFKELYFRDYKKEKFSQAGYCHFLGEYLDHLQLFHDWDPNMRKLIYYEDLVEDPFAVIQELAVFFGADPHELIENFDTYRQRALTKVLSREKMAIFETKNGVSDDPNPLWVRGGVKRAFL